MQRAVPFTGRTLRPERDRAHLSVDVGHPVSCFDLVLDFVVDLEAQGRGEPHVLSPADADLQRLSSRLERGAGAVLEVLGAGSPLGGRASKHQVRDACSLGERERLVDFGDQGEGIAFPNDRSRGRIERQDRAVVRLEEDHAIGGRPHVPGLERGDHGNESQIPAVRLHGIDPRRAHSTRAENAVADERPSGRAEDEQALDRARVRADQPDVAFHHIELWGYPDDQSRTVGPARSDILASLLGGEKGAAEVREPPCLRVDDPHPLRRFRAPFALRGVGDHEDRLPRKERGQQVVELALVVSDARRRIEEDLDGRLGRFVVIRLRHRRSGEQEEHERARRERAERASGEHALP